ncbi:hypothetical protein [Streptomyces sp. CBMA123]|uniref:hypothetical protein n=1 Tax=Streptomyces sp. CBMA123 TaxID=1896313 RepID=UPI001661A872|nr:hypothetical protein [Streptomyces sp. CBMA123]MBD0691229.1 hypothetical protein [Streptomyces sp. CBMA123]
MITTSLRLPKPVMDEVRRRARERGMKPTAVMREWIEAAVADVDEPVPLSVTAAAVAEHQQRRSAVAAEGREARGEGLSAVEWHFARARSWEAIDRAERLHRAEKRGR